MYEAPSFQVYPGDLWQGRGRHICHQWFQVWMGVPVHQIPAGHNPSLFQGYQARFWVRKGSRVPKWQGRVALTTFVTDAATHPEQIDGPIGDPGDQLHPEPLQRTLVLASRPALPRTHQMPALLDRLL